MSQTTNNGVRCDGCGRISRDSLGEYLKPDGSVGYINSRGRESDDDYCDECERKQSESPTPGA